jgi:adenylate cyclase
LKNQGHIDKYIGDGLMALFGINAQSDQEICLSAIRAALDMRDQLDGLNVYLDKHFKTRLKVGIGIHFGPAIMGNFGHPQVMHYTALGDTVNTASRIESMTRKLKTDLLISDEVYQLVKDKLVVSSKHELPLRGKDGLFQLYAVQEFNRYWSSSDYRRLHANHSREAVKRHQ